MADLSNSLSGYYVKSETSSAAEIQGALDGKQPTGDYALVSQLPTKTSELSNDSGYITSAQVEPSTKTGMNGYAANSEYATRLKALDATTGAGSYTDRGLIIPSLNYDSATNTYALELYGSVKGYYPWILRRLFGTDFSPAITLEWRKGTIYRKRVAGGTVRWSIVYNNNWMWLAKGQYAITCPTGDGNPDGKLYVLNYEDETHPNYINDPATDVHTITYNNNNITSIDGQAGGETSQAIWCTRTNPYPIAIWERPFAYRNELSAKADLSALNAVESSLSDYYTKGETSSDAEIGAALGLKQDKLTDEQMANVDTKCLPLNLSGYTAISGNNYLDFHCLPRFFSPVVMHGVLDVTQLNIVNYEVDSYTALSAIDEDTLGFVGGFNREHVAVLDLKSDTIAYISDIDAMISSKADLSALEEVESTLSDYYKKSETSSNTEISAALALKQDKLSDAQISSINNVVDERKTYFTFPNNDIQSVYVEGMLDTNYLWELNPELTHEKILTATEVKIGTAVTGIGYAAFNGCSNLVKVTIPDSVVTIGEMAFRACYALVSLEIPDGVSTINNLFNYTDVHADVVFGKGVQSISQGMFHYVSPANVTFKGKTMAEVQAMTDYPWDIEDTSIIKTYNIATQEWVLQQLSALEARIAALEGN